MAENYSFPRDLLREFVCGGGNNFPINPKEETPEKESPENIELSLGLSLNGRFGVEPKKLVANSYLFDDKKLIRASSVTNFLSFPANTDDSTPLSLYSPVTRTCSLPAERTKRKELQSLRRSEAKRKREEKLKNVSVVKGKTEDNWEINRGNSMNGIEELKPPSPPQLPPLAPPRQFPTQGSIGSQGSGGSSGVSDFESQQITESSKSTEIKSPVRQQSVSQLIERNPSLPKRPSNISDKASTKSSRIAKDETLKTMLADMPCVSTKEEGPNGKKIEGFLYKYKKGEDLRIVCVCHGSFLTPAEFVKHGGGGDVEHPLRHIVVSPSSFCQ